MIELVKKILGAQFEAALAMMNECLEKCPPGHWDGTIGTYPFWQVAYHTLCFADLYLTPDEADFKTRADLHPKGMAELADEYPSRQFTQQELIGYAIICRDKAGAIMAAETAASLAGPSGHARRTFSRGELHLYNMRHIQHHTGQLSAYLRRIGVDTGWVSTGWR